MKKIYLHIGHFKTGTSAIQKYLDLNNEKLNDSGFHYIRGLRPSYNETNHGKLSVSLIKKFNGTKPGWYIDEDSFESCIASLKNEVNESDFDKYIISSEEFYRISILPEQDRILAMNSLVDSLSDYDVSIVFFSRQPLSLMKSWYNQINKGHNPVKKFVQVFYEQSVMFYCQYETILLWRRFFGEDKVYHLPYRLKGSDHINSFLNCIGLPSFCCDSSEVNSKKDESVLEKERQIKIRSIAGDNSVAFTKSISLINDTNFKVMENKLLLINEDYRKLANDYNLPEVRSITTHDIVSYGEKVNAIECEHIDESINQVESINYSFFSRLIRFFK